MNRSHSSSGRPGAEAGVHAAEGPSGLEFEIPDLRLLELERDQLAEVTEEEKDLLDAGRLLRPWGRRPKRRMPGEVRAKKVFGDDDRRLIADTRVYPWSAICSLRIEAADGLPLVGTGWLAGTRLVVTAGHCVYQHDHGGWARSIEVAPGRNADDYPYGPFVSTVFRSVDGWVRDRDPTIDYGAVLLEGGTPPGDLTGWFGFAAASARTLRSATFNLAGYPDERPPGTLWWHARRIDLVRQNSLGYTIDTEGGQSGAPLWKKTNGGRQVVGIHGGGLGGLNQAVRINSRVWENLSAWSRIAG